jgi:hypothetical protein
LSNDSIKAIKELYQRKNEALRLYRCMPTQEPAYKSDARELLIRGGNRCKSADTLVWHWPNIENVNPSMTMPLAKHLTPMRLGDVQPGDVIVGFANCKPMRMMPSRVLNKTTFTEEGIKITINHGNGKADILTTVCTFDHPLWACPVDAETGKRQETKACWVLASELSTNWYVKWQYVTNTKRLNNYFQWKKVIAVEKTPPTEMVGIKTATETYIGDGFYDHNSGKTTICATMFAAIATDQPIITKEGEHIDCRYPHQKDRELLMWCIGYQQKHIGQTLYRVLFRPGMFSVIKDHDSEMWRPFDPDRDAGRENEKRPSAPLIPERFIEPNSWAWESKSERVFTGVRIIEPITKKPLAQIYAYTSTGEPKTGDPVDCIWIDEHIAFEQHYPEWQARLIDTKGRLFWSSWPRTSNMALRDLSKRAKEDAEKGIGRVREFVFKMRENPYLSKEAKEDALAGWTEDEQRARDSGEFLTDNLLIYPSFDKYVHAAIRPEDNREDDISKILRERNGDPPRDWCRELILDPGTQRPGVLFCAIPPPTYGDWLIVYDEIYIPRLNAEQLANVIRQKAQGQFFHRFIVDGHAARQKPMGFGHTVGEAYQRAFEKRGITCSQTGSMFIPGSDDFSSRSHLVQEALHIRNDGTPRLRFVIHKLPNLVDQMESNVKHQKDDLRVCAEYWLSRNPTYEAPPLDKISSSPAFEYYQQFKERREANNEEETDDDTVHIGRPESEVDDFVGAF